MDLFKLVGTIAIDTANAEKSLNDVHKQVADTEKAVSEGCDKVKQSSEKAGKTICDPDYGSQHYFFRNPV